jgi:hypothetical protein
MPMAAATACVGVIAFTVAAVVVLHLAAVVQPTPVPPCSYAFGRLSL